MVMKHRLANALKNGGKSIDVKKQLEEDPMLTLEEKKGFLNEIDEKLGRIQTLVIT